MGRKPKFAHRGTTVSFRIDEETYAERKEEIRRAITETIAKFERDRASGSPPSIEAPAIEPKKSEIEELYDEFGDFVDERADPALKEVAKTRKKS